LEAPVSFKRVLGSASACGILSTQDDDRERNEDDCPSQGGNSKAAA
jgi:hypothetical protein